MVLIDIDDDVWNLYMKSWAIHGSKTKEEVIEDLEWDMERLANVCIEDGKSQLISDEPEALVLRAIGIQDEKAGKRKPEPKPPWQRSKKAWEKHCEEIDRRDRLYEAFAKFSVDRGLDPDEERERMMSEYLEKRGLKEKRA